MSKEWKSGAPNPHSISPTDWSLYIKILLDIKYLVIVYPYLGKHIGAGIDDAGKCN